MKNHQVVAAGLEILKRYENLGFGRHCNKNNFHIRDKVYTYILTYIHIAYIHAYIHKRIHTYIISHFAIEKM